MPINVVIKTRINNMEMMKTRVNEMGGDSCVVIQQRDTFFNTQQGLLKLRFLQNSASQLILYNRPDSKGPKPCDYLVSETNNPESLQSILKHALGIRGEVRKTRMLYMIGQTRVHFDVVEGLGNFMELEVVLREDQTVEEGQRIAEDIMFKLGIEKDDLVSCAYMDLLDSKTS